MENDIRLRLPYFGGLRKARTPGKDFNPFWPLPPWYDKLSASEQSQARVAIVTTQRTPEELVIAWDTFRRLYLMNTEPGFFYHNFRQSPPFHYDSIYDLGRYDRNLLAAPRGTAKSVILGTEVPLFLGLTRPYFRMVLCLATDVMVEQRLDKISHQICNNENILMDFGLQKPKRGAGKWNGHNMNFVNGSELQGVSVDGRKRGARPDLFLLDDPEYDADNPGAAPVLRDKFETLMFRQVIPMLEDGSGIFWVGTMIGARSFLHHAAVEDEERFGYWNRKVLTALDMDQFKAGVSADKINALWESKWSGEVMEKRKKEVGVSAFMTEYMNTPGSSQERVFTVHPQANEYSVRDYDMSRSELPLANTSGILEYHDWNLGSQTGTKVEVEPCKHYNKLYRVITIDPAEGLSSHHDYTSITVLGFDTRNCMWVLDAFLGRIPRAALVIKAFKMAVKWRVKAIGVESVSMQITLTDAISMYMEEALYGYEGDWKPRVIPVDYRDTKGARGKADRISMLGPRFIGGQIKYPAHLKNSWPISELYHQTEDFTYDLQLLSHDDIIDSVAMSGFMMHGKGIIFADSPEGAFNTDLDTLMLRDQQTIAGIPIISAYGSNTLSAKQIQILVDKAYQQQYNKPGTQDLRMSGSDTTRTKTRYEPYNEKRRRQNHVLDQMMRKF